MCRPAAKLKHIYVILANNGVGKAALGERSVEYESE
eukprot:CAMPEP_0197689970 /NCGR_PEP_ID=MMETSP1338-20131121/107658_1 /TAXON_ID=43686 ORGANISM="Pelagodinium beii, Strain RCC1491" /NCGR_SAMPLE_ID=MMETSP1338 /ASSEMBLY_ACC=CAM_ASM_000754 /LENGTH=35 /DNA_ID= /DNA_START= /DNA_END= /DNA_ORIENTATION=